MIQEGNTSIHVAAHFGQFEIVKYTYWKNKCDPNALGRWNSTLLHASSKYLEVAGYLVGKHCLQLHLKDTYSNTAYHYATPYGHLQVVQYFLDELESDVSVRGQYERTLLHNASQNGHLDNSKVLGQNSSLQSNRYR